jgi:hypothetical protein
MARMLALRTGRLPLPHRKYSWYTFLLEAESTPGPLCGRKDYVNEKFQWHHRESNACSAVPQPIEPPRTPNNIISYLISRRYSTAYFTGRSYIHTENRGLISFIGVFPGGCATLQNTQPFLQRGFEPHRDDTVPVTPLSSSSTRTSERTQFLSISTTRLQSHW